jgi:peptidyl-prolyl cis-trans isomerase C
MYNLIRPGLLALVALGVTLVGQSQAQQPTPKTAPATPARGAVAAPASAPVQPPSPDLREPVATVNGEVITKGDLLDLLSKYPIPSGPAEQIYRDAVETIINTRLVGQYLSRLRIPVDEAKINAELDQLDKQFKAEGTSLATRMAENNVTMDDLKRQLATRQRWVDFVKSKATEAELQRFADAHQDLFSGTKVRASHIMLRVEPDAKPEEKEKVRKKLLGLKQEIVGGKINFAEAANKNSEDPANVSGAGGDLGYFGLNSGFIEEFANAAFAMKKGEISDPVETPYGYHLILLTDRKEGQKIDLQQQKPLVQQMYATELQKNVLTAERKTAKIDIKPMPADLFPAPPVGTPAPESTPATKGATPAAK